MKTALITAAFLTLALGTGHAASAKPVDSSQLYTCAGNALSRVALRSTPVPCCDGMLGCPQLLANTGLLKPRRDNRT